MHRLVGNEGTDKARGIIDISMSQADSWPAVPGMTGLAFHALLMGDEKAGPYLAIVAIPARTEPMPLFPAHGHGTDTWRITLRGEMNMGARKYLPGEFRYQEGNKPYGSDDLAWGPHGGLSIVIMADRRGTPSFPPDRNPEVIRQARARTQPLFDWLGIDMQEDYSAPGGIVTTLERTPRAVKAEGSHEATATWQEIMPGTRVSAGMLGEREVGPVLLHVRAEPGAAAFPASAFATEVLHIGVSGSADIKNQGEHGEHRVLREGDLRLIPSGVASGAVIAGDNGYAGTIVFGDRRGLRETLASPVTGGLDAEWSGFLRDCLERFTAELASR